MGRDWDPCSSRVPVLCGQLRRGHDSGPEGMVMHSGFCFALVCALRCLSPDSLVLCPGGS